MAEVTGTEGVGTYGPPRWKRTTARGLAWTLSYAASRGIGAVRGRPRSGLASGQVLGHRAMRRSSVASNEHEHPQGLLEPSEQHPHDQGIDGTCDPDAEADSYP